MYRSESLTITMTEINGDIVRLILCWKKKRDGLFYLLSQIHNFSSGKKCSHVSDLINARCVNREKTYWVVCRLLRPLQQRVVSSQGSEQTRSNILTFVCFADFSFLSYQHFLYLSPKKYNIYKRWVVFMASFVHCFTKFCFPFCAWILMA